MKRSWLALIFVLVWQAVPARAESLAVGGRIVDSDGKPVRGASIELVPMTGAFAGPELRLQDKAYPPAAARAASRDDGRFEVVAPAPGMWQVRVAVQGFVPRIYSLVPLLEPTELPELQMARDKRLRVRVLDAKGRPLAGAHVAAGSPFPEAYWMLPVELALTGADGTVEIHRARGPLEVQALAPGLPETSVKIDSADKTAELRLPSACERVIAVSVPAKGGESQPVAGALVTTDGWTLGATDAAGRLAVPAPCDRDLRITVLTRDGQREEATLRRGPAGGTPVAVRLPVQPASLSGRVVEAGTRAPVAGALVWPSEDPAAFVRTDAKGGYTVPAPAAGSPRIAAAAVGYQSAQEKAVGAAGPTLSLAPQATVAGVVVDEAGQPVLDAVLRALPEEGRGRGFGPAMFRGISPPARSGPQGLFRLTVPPGKAFTLTASHPAFSAARLPMAELAARQARRNVRIVLQRGLSAYGMVVDTAGKPLSGAEVVLSPTPESGNPFSFMRMDREGPETPATTDAQGRFSLEHLEPGRFDLEASAHGFAPTVVRGIDIAAAASGGEGGQAGPVNLGTVALAPGVALEGIVVDPQSRPIAGVRIITFSMARFAFRPRGPAEDDEEILTAADGSFSIPDLRAGEKIGLTAAKKGYKSARFDQVDVPGTEPLRITLTPGVRISGRVLDESGEPVADARVAETRLGTQIAVGAAMLGGFASSQADGRYVLEGVEPGKARITARAQGFRSKDSPDLDLVAGRDVEDLDLVLERGATLAGRIVGPDGAPVAGASVQRIESSKSGPVQVILMGSRFGGGGATSDGDGNYRLEGLEEGPQSFSAEADDFQRTVKDLDVRGGENRLDFRLEAGFEVAGRVIDSGGQPVAGARVQMVEPGTPSFAFSFGREDARSAADGSFRVRGVAPGIYDVQADKEGFAPARRESLQVTASVQGLELRLEAGGSVHGRLTGLEFSELAGARVYAAMRDGARPAMQNGSVDYQGQYRVDGLTAGEWSVSARTDSGRQAQGKVTVAQGSDAVLDLEFGEGVTLTGRVVRGGEPVPNLNIFVSSRDGAGSGNGTSDPQGAFRIEGLKPGTYELHAMDFRSGISHEETVELSGDRDLLIEISTRRVSGRVVDAQDQAPLRDVEVSLESAEDKPGGGRGSAIPRQSTSDSSGLFELTDVSPGAYRLRAQKEGYSPGDTQLQVGAETDVNDVRLALQPTQGLTLQVRSSVGSPPSGVEVVLVDAAGQVKATGSYATGENGRVRFDTAPPGSWRLLTTAAGSATVSQDVQVPGPPVPVLLYPATRLAVTVPAPAGTEVTVQVTGADGQPFRTVGWGGSVQQEWRIYQAQAVIDDLPPGSWQIRATAPGGQSWQGAVTTSPAGGSASIVLR